MGERAFLSPLPDRELAEREVVGARFMARLQGFVFRVSDVCDSVWTEQAKVMQDTHKILPTKRQHLEVYLWPIYI